MTSDAPGFAILPISESDREDAVRVLATSFATDPYTTGLLPDGRTEARLTALFRRVVAEALAAGGHVYIARDTDGIPLGVAAWEAPGSRAPLLAEAAGVPAYLRIFGARVFDAARSEAAARRDRPRAPHWYLKSIGTVPRARGLGVGSALIRSRLAIADRADEAAYLEASTVANVPFYERFGFVTRSRIRSVGTVPCFGMWREPRA